MTYILYTTVLILLWLLACYTVLPFQYLWQGRINFNLSAYSREEAQHCQDFRLTSSDRSKQESNIFSQRIEYLINFPIFVKYCRRVVFFIVNKKIRMLPTKSYLNSKSIFKIINSNNSYQESIIQIPPSKTFFASVVW